MVTSGGGSGGDRDNQTESYGETGGDLSPKKKEKRHPQ